MKEKVEKRKKDKKKEKEEPKEEDDNTFEIAKKEPKVKSEKEGKKKRKHEKEEESKKNKKNKKEEHFIDPSVKKEKELQEKILSNLINGDSFSKNEDFVEKEEQEDENYDYEAENVPIEKEEKKKPEKTDEEKANEQKERESRTIYVCDLPEETTDKELQKKFKKFGKIEEVRFHPQDKTKAWVQFIKASSAQSAAETTEQTIKEQAIQVCMAKSKREINDDATIFIRNLSFETDEGKLSELFKDCGDIVFIRIPKFEDTGKPRGVAYIEFENVSSVDLALEYTGTIIDGRKITVMKSKREEKAKPLSFVTSYSNTIHVGGLSYYTTEEGLKKHFESAGEISAVRMPYYEDTGKPKGFAFLEFATSEAVENARKLNGTQLDGRRIRVDYGSRDGKPEKKNTTIYVRNLSFNTNEERLRDFFGEAGTILSVKIPVFEDSGKSRGIAYIEFETDEMAKKALSYHCNMLDGRKINIEFSFKD